MKALLKLFKPYDLFQPVSGVTLALFRMLMGGILVWETYRYYPRLAYGYILPRFHFTYDFFHFVSPLPGDWMYVHMIVMRIAALFFCLGFLYRISSVVLFFCFAYFFLLEQAYYLNHFYLVTLVLFFMPFLRAADNLSFDAYFFRRQLFTPIPFWNVFLVRIQIFVVYFYGGIAKINMDWLQGEPLRNWLASRQQISYIGEWLVHPFAPYFFSYGGLFFDLGIGFVLLSKRWRILGVLGVLFFNLTNAHIFSIGIFPWFMLAVTLVFFGGEPKDAEIIYTPRMKQVIVGALSAYLAFQFLYPLRHHLIPGDVAWTEEGHRFSWRMKLRDKEATIIFLTRKNSDTPYELVVPYRMLTKRQTRKMTGRPDMVYQFAQELKRRMIAEGDATEPDIRAIHLASVNGRPFQFMVDPKVNLATAEYSPFYAASWIRPLNEELEPGVYPRYPNAHQLLRYAHEHFDLKVPASYAQSPSSHWGPTPGTGRVDTSVRNSPK